LRNKYFLLPLILLITSIGFSSTAFATDDFLHLPAPPNFDSSFNYFLIDLRPFTIDQLISSSQQFPNDIQSDLQIINFFSGEGLVGNSIFDDRYETSNLLAMLLFVVPFGALVFRMCDEESLSKNFLRLSTIFIFLGAGSMITAQTLVAGNSIWGYAFAALEPEVILPDAIDSLRFDHSDKDNISFEGAGRGGKSSIAKAVDENPIELISISESMKYLLCNNHCLPVWKHNE